MRTIFQIKLLVSLDVFVSSKLYILFWNGDADAMLKVESTSTVQLSPALKLE